MVPSKTTGLAATVHLCMTSKNIPLKTVSIAPRFIAVVHSRNMFTIAVASFAGSDYCSSAEFFSLYFRFIITPCLTHVYRVAANYSTTCGVRDLHAY